MPTDANILAFAGSTRTGSFNRQVLQIACDGAKAAGGNVTLVDLKDYELPFYNADLEKAQGVPAAAKRLRELAKAHAGLLIASPEYNGGYTPLLKNTLDWMSRPDGQEPELVAFKGKAAALVGASPGRMAALRGISQISTVLGHLGLIVMPFPVGVGQAREAFDNGQLKDPKLAERVRTVGANLVKFVLSCN